MRLFHKRLFIMFSVALNIGFVIMAVIMFYHHSRSFNERAWLEIVDMVHRLELPQGREGDILEHIRQFRVTFDKHHEDIKSARGDIIRLLAQNGPLDQDRLHRLIAVADDRERLKNEAFEAHVTYLRNQLGNEKGARFFSMLLAHLNARDKMPP